MEKGKHILILIFFTGLCLGVIYANWKLDTFLEQKGVFQTFFLSEYARITVQKKEYLFYLLKIRLIPLILLLTLSVSRYRKPVGMIWLAGNSFLLGLLFVTAVLCPGYPASGLDGLQIPGSSLEQNQRICVAHDVCNRYPDGSVCESGLHENLPEFFVEPGKGEQADKQLTG